jgi:hypothetical protein
VSAGHARRREQPELRAAARRRDDVDGVGRGPVAHLVRRGGGDLLRLERHLSCGVGIRYETPVGPLRLDVAYRIPGLNPAPGSPDYPGDIVGLPFGVAFGIGEAF